MRIIAYASIKLTLLLVLGISIGSFLSIPLFISFLLLLGCFLICTYFFIWRIAFFPKFEIAIAMTIITLGIFIITYAQPINHPHHFSKLYETNNPVLKIKIREVLKPNAFSQNYLATVEHVDNQKSTGKILLNSSKSIIAKPFQIDDEFILNASPSNLKPPLNPHQFNYKKYMERLGVYQQAKLTKGNYIKIPNAKTTIIGKARKIRSQIIEELGKKDFGKEQLAIIQALLLGDRSQISEETYSSYINAGAVHILAVSGLHIGVLLFIIQILLKPLTSLPHGKIIVLITTLILLWGFAFIAGLSPSIIRACSMFSFVAYAMYLNRPSNNFNILALSMFFVLLLVNPNLLFQVGFQLSYAAVFAIVWIYPLLQKFWYPKNRVLRYVWQLFSVSIAAQLGVLPISLFYFHQFPGLFFISNLLIVPFLAFILGIGLFIILLSLLGVTSTKLVWLYNEIIGFMNGVVDWVAQQEAFIFKSISFDGLQLALGFLVIGLLVYALERKKSKPVFAFLIGLFTFQVYTISKAYLSDRKSEVLILHQVKNSVLLNRNGSRLNIITRDSLNAWRLVDNYIVEERIVQTNYSQPGNIYLIKNNNFQIIDSTGVYMQLETPSTFLITQSPKLNFERFVQKVKPKEIIVDGSNYPSFINHWRATCSKYKIPFHHTGEMGFYKVLP